MKKIKFFAMALGAIVLAAVPAVADSIIPPPEVPLETALTSEARAIPLPPVRPASFGASAGSPHEVRGPAAVSRLSAIASPPRAKVKARPAPVVIRQTVAYALPPVQIREARNCTSLQCAGYIVMGVGF